MYNKILLSTNGCRIYFGETGLVIDPVHTKCKTALLSCANSALTAISGCEYDSAYTTAWTKKQLIKGSYHTELTAGTASETQINEITDCRLRARNRLRQKGEVICEFAFYGYNSESAAIMIRTEKTAILYITEAVDKISALPEHDILIINAKSKPPIGAMLNSFSEICIEITDFSKLGDVFSYFNGASLYEVGVDSSVLPAACEYLKLGYTVFSKSVKPLTAYSHIPRIIITAKPGEYSGRIAISQSAFVRGISLSDIYRISSESAARHILTVSDSIQQTKKRGNLILCKNNTLFEFNS